MPKNSTLNIKIMSVGGRGANILERLASFDHDNIDRIAAGFNDKVFSRIQVKQKIELTKEKNFDKVEDVEILAQRFVEEK